MFSEGPVVSSFERTQLTLVGRESSVLVLVVNGLLTVPEHSTTTFAGVAAFFPMDMFLVLVENNVGDESFVTFITRLPDAHVYGLYVLFQGKFAFPEVANEFFRTKLADNLSLRTATKKNSKSEMQLFSLPPSLPVYLPHVELEGVRRVVLPVPQLFDFRAEVADDWLREGVVVELFNMLREIVLRLLLLPAHRTHTGGGRPGLLALLITGTVHRPQVSIFSLLRGENLLALFTF